MSTRAMACRAVLACAAAWIWIAPACANDDAHAVADRFASEPERSAAAKLEAERKAEDARKREAELKADAARKAEAARRAAQMRKADEDQARAKAKQAQGTRRATERDSAEEADMLARARREAEEMAAIEEARILAEQEAAMQRTQAELLASQEAEQERAKLDALAREAAGSKPAVNRDAEAERELAEWTRRAQATRQAVRSLERVRKIREARLAAQAQRLAAAARARKPVDELPGQKIADTTKPTRAAVSDRETAWQLADKTAREPDVGDLGKSRQDPTVADLRRTPEALPGSDLERKAEALESVGLRERIVTVLVVMAPGTYGIRKRGPKVADPVLCTLDGCYISTGPGSAANYLPLRKALGFGNTMGGRAGACRRQLGCIFRGVDLGREGFLQPVDMHILKHDRRRGQTVESDSGCRVDGGSITCSRGIYAEDYAMWVIPESMAAKVGAAGLERTLEEGLAAPRSAELGTRPLR